MKGSSILTCCHKGLWLLWFSSHHLHLQLSPLQHPWRQIKLSLSFGLSLYLLSRSPGCLESFSNSLFECFWPLLTRSSLPAWPLQEPSDLSGLEPDGPLELPLATVHAVQPPPMTIRELSDLSGLDPSSLPLDFMQFVPLSFICTAVSDCCILCIYCILFHYVAIIHSFCSSMI
jgi:hypothetical protein